MADLLESLNEAQRAAVTHENGPLLIVAGAGTGKTAVLTRRYAWLLRERSLDASRILSLTFTDKAAGEMEDRILQLLPNGAYDFWIHTFHGFCQRVLESHAVRIGLPHKFKLLNETESWLFVTRHYPELPLDYYTQLGNPRKFLSALLKHFSRAQDEDISPEVYSSFAKEIALDADVETERSRLEELASCYAIYRKLMRDEGYLDFGSLLIETLRLFRERPEILSAYQKQFNAILVDEFQDTNGAQYELIKLLAGEDRNITVVGDDDQAIYKFRGASLSNILQFRDDFPDATTVALRQNYRSAQEILDVSGAFIRKNDPNRLEAQLKEIGLDKTLQSARDDVRGDVRAIWYENIEDEAEATVERMIALKNADPETQWNDMAILARSNESAMPFVRALERADVPYLFHALRGLYSKPVVLDLLALLGMCVSTQDSPFAFRVLTLPSFAFPPSDLAAVIRFAEKKRIGLWDALRRSPQVEDGLSDAGKKAAESVLSLFNSLTIAAHREPPLSVLHTAIKKSKILENIMTGDEASRMEQIAYINAFVRRVERYESLRHNPTVLGLLEEVRMEIESGDDGALRSDPNDGPDQVKVMTVHASKGLEFKHVFVVSLVDQRFPTREREDAIPLPDGLVREKNYKGGTHLEEERRLMYVAMTRAKQSLTLTGAADVGGIRKKKPSVFFEEASVEVSTAPTGKDRVSQFLNIAERPTRETSEAELLTYLPLKRRFSFTQLAAFRSCPMQYKFAHVYRIPIIGSHQKSFGQVMHSALHDILEKHTELGKAEQGSLFGDAGRDVQSAECGVRSGGLRVAKDEALEIYETRWNENDFWYPDRAMYDKYHAEGKDAVSRMWNIWNENPPKVAALELNFDWKIGEHSIRGSVDRIDDCGDGTVAIFDYKTGQPKTDDDIGKEEREQLQIYQLAMECRGMKVSSLSYVYLQSGESVNVQSLGEKERVPFTDALLERMNEILKSRFTPKPSQFICKFCDFRNICEFRKT